MRVTRRVARVRPVSARRVALDICVKRKLLVAGPKGVGVVAYEMTALDGGRAGMETDSALESHGSNGVLLEGRELTASLPVLPDVMLNAARLSGQWREVSIEHYSAQQGEVTIAHMERQTIDLGLERWVPMSFLAWVGNRYSLYLHESASPTEQLLKILATLSLSEGRSGLTARSSNGKALNWTRTPSIVTEERGTTQLEIRPLTSVEAKRLPRHGGTTVRGGELYARYEADEDGVDSLRDLTLVTDTAVVRGVPVPQADPQSCVDLMSNCLCAWSTEPGGT